MAATSVAKLMQIRKAIRESLSSFQGVEHRLESIEDPNVQYINDSKATNVNANFLHLTVCQQYGLLEVLIKERLRIDVLST
jgi:UDP-N-acetylmuramoylalanine--D-glutamate ligase